jgi:long-chain acyl-CoA synthetase
MHFKLEISSCGWLSKPKLPNIRGIEKFLGMSFHSAEWKCDYDYKGKKVAIIGNAASAVQVKQGFIEFSV